MERENGMPNKLAKKTGRENNYNGENGSNIMMENDKIKINYIHKNNDDNSDK